MADSDHDAPKKKKKKGMTADIGGVKIKVKAKKSGQKGGSKKQDGGKKKDHSAFEAFAKLAESPLVADLIAVGATAAVAALTESMKDRTSSGGKTNVKAAGKAAAAAIGRRLMSEYEAVKEAGKDAADRAKKA